MKSVYLDCTDFGQSVLTTDILSKVPDLEIHVGDPDEGTLDRMMAGAVGVINGHTIMDEAFLSRYPTLRTIVFLGTGASVYIDVSAAERLGIKVRTVRGYGDRTIAEHAFALIMAGARSLASMDREIRRGEWNTPGGVELAGKRLGVVGTGGIGRELVRMASAFGMEVVAWNRSGVPADLPCKAVALDELLETAHVVSLHLALTDATLGMFNRSKLEKLRQDAILVNVARGALVDEAALVDVLRQGRIAHAALDVFEQEPLPRDHPLTTLDNVTLTSHAAFKSREAMTRLLSDGFDLLRADLLAYSAQDAAKAR
ncbi:NAD(P)-dependent oxidoreductase [Mesorhizobium sp. B2-6-5]|uniref:2-hydroxyacid dehydrogenase n=1 Tax=Mesorhizobium sp. B2-6-5 TaxID=2589912 RepID=UPI001128F5B1|nr:NAD(P)-dependent oxidoreductase [Mesorhizobium sp. B2-6-5]TPJ33476.1 3-phosphoglycerate dehydrogenase [Mesorhizobium sp. B2-6-5]